ncbi:MAG: PKD domain-containing protein [Deltaproteobacteria bacterium]|nr:PKD domain-containing protein [Deltaproteobacteria bacterium]
MKSLELHFSRSCLRLPVLMMSALCLSIGFGASAFEYKLCVGENSVWNTNTVPFEAALISFPSSSSYRTALNTAAAGWNSNTPASQFGFDISYQDSSSYNLGNGINNIMFTHDFDWSSVGIGVARTRRGACLPPWFLSRIREVDILFNPAASWSPVTRPLPPLGNDPRYFTVVALHEMGHALGLQHVGGFVATMGAYPGGGTLGNLNDFHPHADEAAGVRDGYGSAGVARDLAASTFEPIGATGSQEIRTRATTYRGIPQSFKFTIENRGTEQQSNVPVSFYLSTNRIISTFDTLLGTAAFSLDSGAAPTLTASVTVPTSVAAGNYFFGYLIDPSNGIAETNESNNGVAHYKATHVTASSPPNQAPTACFTLTPEVGQSPLLVNVNAACSSDADGSISSYQWDFGGVSRSGVTASHVFVDPGDHLIRLTVTDNDGATAVRIHSAYVLCERGGRCDPPE